jgi:hypothetical protein
VCAVTTVLYRRLVTKRLGIRCTPLHPLPRLALGATASSAYKLRGDYGWRRKFGHEVTNSVTRSPSPEGRQPQQKQQQEEEGGEGEEGEEGAGRRGGDTQATGDKGGHVCAKP